MNETELITHERRLLDLYRMCTVLSETAEETALTTMANEIKLQLDANDKLMHTLSIRKKLDKFKRDVSRGCGFSLIAPAEKQEYVYIATTTRYSLRNQFKVGSTRNLAKRLCGYQTGRPKDDKYFYTDWFKCRNAMKLERTIGEVLARWKDSDRCEIYVLHYSVLKRVVEAVCAGNEDDCAAILATPFDDWEPKELTAKLV